VKEALSFDDVLLVPQYSEIESRSKVSTRSDLDSDNTYRLPVISSPMDTVTEVEMAKAMAKAGGLGVIHRYNTIDKQKDIFVACEGNPAVAIGATGDFMERATYLFNHGAKIFCVDTAHGHHSAMRRCLSALRERFDEDIHIMAGNVATREAFDDLASWGANSIRVGIGSGAICSTRLVAGSGMPVFQSIIECAKSTSNAALIADGGVRTTGDMVKALAAGADFVMIGSMLAGTKESPGEIFTGNDGKKYKVYRGMASKAAQVDWRGSSSTPEGISTTIPYKGKVSHVLADIQGGINSGLSYSGCATIQELRNKCEFIRQTPAGQHESYTHILTRK